MHISEKRVQPLAKNSQIKFCRFEQSSFTQHATCCESVERLIIENLEKCSCFILLFMCLCNPFLNTGCFIELRKKEVIEVKLILEENDCVCE